MKLLYLKFEDFRSIDSFEHGFNRAESNICTPICFVGLNGSGKSNVLEALTEIFSFLDLITLDYKLPRGTSRNSPFSFKIKYSITINGSSEEITLEATKDEKLKNIKKGNADIDINELHLYLPHNIISYSSGDNERISFSSMQNHTFYSAEIRRMARQEKKEKYDKFYKEQVRPLKSIFLDATLNSIIFVVNEIFVEDRTNSIFHNKMKEYIGIERLKSFTINLKLGQVLLKRELLEIIDKLQNCSTVSHGEIKTGLTLKFLLSNEDTLQLFKDEINFGNAMQLFSSLYKLNLLNVLKFTATEKKLYRSREALVLPKQSCIAKEKRIFMLDSLKIELFNNKTIDYIGLSDGEHQFMLVLGMLNLFNNPSTLFLLDEPESHFNPQWRARFVNIVNDISPELRENIVLTTHSPYVISACKKENVIKFSRNVETGVLEHVTPNKETFGDTFDGILSNLFDMDSKISLYTSSYIQMLIQSNDLDKMEDAVFMLAESSEKLKLYDAIYDLEHPDG